MKQKFKGFLIALVSPFILLVFFMRYWSAKRMAKKYILKPESYDVEARYRKLYNVINTVLFLKNIKVEVEELQQVPKVPCVFLSNHKSNLDSLIFYKVLFENPKYPLATFVAKKELMDKSYGLLLDLIDALFIDRKNPRQGLKIIEDEAPKLIKTGRSLVIFPEATRIPGKKLGTFNPGGILPAQKAFCPIVPVALVNTEGQLFDKSSPDRKFNKPKSKKVIISFGQPIKPHNFINLNAKNCMEIVEKQVQKLYDAANEKYFEKPAKAVSDHAEIMADLKTKFKKSKA